MTDPEDPPRLLESDVSPPGLRRALERARADVGSDAQVARLGDKLGPLLGPVPVTPHPASWGAAAVAKTGWAALGLVVATGGAWWLLAGQPSAPAPSARPAAPLSAPTPPAELVAPAPAPELEEAAPSDVAPPLTSSDKSSASPLKLPAASVPTEAELLERARAALRAGDSARALQRASEHAQRYPRGVLVQEREVLAIRALRRLGRDGEADRRAEAFAKAYPGSAFQRKLQR